jgi:capsular polysaccharide transport system permease protein
MEAAAQDSRPAEDAARRIGVLVRAGMAPEARHALDEAAASGASPPLLAAARLLLDAGPPEAAPAESALRPLLGRKADAPAEALAPLLRALAAMLAEPEAPRPRIDAACFLLGLEEPHWAALALQPLWRGSETDGLLARVLSGVWAVLGRREEALETARVAAAGMPASAEAQVHLAGCHLALLQPAPALLAAGRAAGQEPDNIQAWRTAAAALLQLGHVDEALEAAQRAGDRQHFAEAVSVAAETPAAPRATLPATGLADWARVPDLAALTAVRPGLRGFLRDRLRIVDAVMLRETRIMFGHSRLGYIWAVFEPMMHVLFLSLVIYVSGYGGQPRVGENMAVYYMTGVLPYLFFCHLSEIAMDLGRHSRPLLQVPAIGIGDVFAARLLLRAATDITVMLICLGVYLAVGIADLPEDPLSLAAVYLGLIVFGAGTSLVNLVLSSHSTAWERIWPVVLRVQYFVSGIFYHPDLMSPDVRGLVMWNPLLHFVEWYRESFFVNYRSPYLDMAYLLQCSLGGAALGLLLLAASRGRVRVGS